MKNAKKIIAGIAAVLCVMSSVNTSWIIPVKDYSTAITAVAASTEEVPEPGKNAGLYSYKFADPTIYTTKFTNIKIYDKETKITYTWHSADKKYTYGIYKVDVTAIGEKEPALSEYVIGISEANENIIDADLSTALDKDPQVQSFLNKEGIELSSWNVEYIGASAFANSYLKTINLGSVKYIDKSVFSGCQYIAEIELPATVRYVGTGVFSGSGLKKLSVKNDMPVIPDSLCSGTKLTDIEFAHPEFIRQIGKSAFANSAVSAPLFMTSYASDVKDYELLKVGESAYSGCTQIKDVITTDNVSIIGKSAFKGCTSITSLSCGAALFGIDQDAFSGCTALSSITFNKIMIGIGGGAFQNCSSLKTVEGIPETIGDWVVTNKKTGEGYGLGDGVFAGCTSLEKCVLPEALTKIPKNTFSGCKALTTLGFNSGSVGKNIKTICDSAFKNCTSLTEAKFDNVVVIEPNAYYGCTSLLEAVFPKAEYIGGTEDTEQSDRGMIITSQLDKDNCVMKGGGSSFAGCTLLEEVSIPSSLYIFPNTFKNCTSLNKFEAGKCEIVGNYALDGCTGIEEIKLLSKQYGNSAPTKSNTSDGYVFQNCSSAKKITIDAKFLTEFPNKTPNGFFNGCEALNEIATENGDFSKVSVVSTKTFASCKALEEMNLDSVRIIESNAFANCTSLKKVSSSKNMLNAEDYGASAFLNCSSLNINITGVISTIGNSAFKGSGITAVDLEGMQGGTVVIDSNAFESCNKLKSVSILSDSAAKFSIGSSVFANCPELTDVVYEGKIITASMFKNCPSLKNVTTNAKNIKASAFEGDKSLIMLKDKNDTTKTIYADEINTSAFKDCNALSVIPADKNTVLNGTGIFTNCSSIKSADVGMLTANIFSGCTNLSDVKLNDITEIPASAFAYCSSLEDIDIANMITIGNNAFVNSGLKSVKLDIAQNINTSAFANCNSLTSIDVVATNINAKAFNNCQFLENATLNVDKIGSSAFENCASLRNVTLQSSGSHKLNLIDSSAFSNCPVLYELIVEGNPKMLTKSVGFVSGKVNGDFVLVGEPGSTVETYANANKIAFVPIGEFDLNARKLARNVPGDIDGNTVISVADAVKLQSWLLGKPTPGIIGSNMDLDGDKRVDAFDMVAMRKKLVNK